MKLLLRTCCALGVSMSLGTVFNKLNVSNIIQGDIICQQIRHTKRYDIKRTLRMAFIGSVLVGMLCLSSITVFNAGYF